MMRLRACPFCEEQEDLQAFHANEGYRAIICGSCHAEGPPAATEHDAAHAWGLVDVVPAVKH